MMKKKTLAAQDRRAFSTRIVTLLASLCAALAVAHAGAQSLSLVPGSSSAAAGTTFSLDLVGTDLADLYAFQFALNFDPTVIHVLGVTEGAALPSAGTTFFVPGAADNVGGALELSGDTLIGPIPGFSGSGVLASISFTAVAAGATTVSFSDVLALTSSFGLIVPTLLDARVDVTGGVVGAVPEPSSSLLLALGLAALWLWRMVGARARQQTAH
jgi:hypothetical protein